MIELHTPSIAQNMVVVFLFSLPVLALLATIGFCVKLLLAKSSRPNTKKFAWIFFSFLINGVVIFSTLFLPKTITDPNQQRHIYCGAPLPFLIVTSYKNPPLPRTQSCMAWMGNPMETPKLFFWQPFVLNILLVFGVINMRTFKMFVFRKTKRVIF